MNRNEFVIESGKVRPYLPFVIYFFMYLGSEYLAIIALTKDDRLPSYVLPISIQLMLAWATWYIWKYQIPQLRIMERLSISGEDGFCITLKYVRNEVTLFGNAADIESVTCETFTVGNGSDTHVLLKIKDLGLVGFRSWRRSQAEKLCASISLPLSVTNTESQTQSLRDKDLEMTEYFSLLRGPQVLRFAFANIGNCLAALLVSVLSNSSAHAWGTEGHQVIATLAEQQLTPAARKEVDRLLALEPGQTLASISAWADEHRNPQTAGWHYINFPRGTYTYEAARDCPDGKCLVEAINRQVEVLTSNAPDEARLTAFKYLVHLVGDVHQPLHAGYRDDRGGNTYQLQAFMRGSNLHAVWDTGLIKSLNEDAEMMARRLATKPVKFSPDWSAASAAQDSCRIVATPGFYPERLVTMDYVAKYTPVMEDRLVEAGARLAQVLNRVGR